MLNKRATYGDDWGVPSAEHPAGPCLNRSAPGVEDGSYFEKSWVNDLMALPGAIMNAAGYTPNGTEDTATASQVFDALVNNRWSAIGNYSVGTVVTASNGKQYYCNKENGRDTSPVDPKSDISDNWREMPFSETSGSGFTYRKYPDGRVLIFGETAPSNGIAYITYPFPIHGVTPSKIRITNLSATIPSSFEDVPQNTVITGSIDINGFSISCLSHSGSPSGSTVSWEVEGTL
ncbi:immunoglobulin-like domain protein [Vibrio phage 1.112.O._10N.286.46.B11]|nr:immunoglobulin-like domain protein [Vibrio phage 1.112.O._10N.286.46.B11]